MSMLKTCKCGKMIPMSESLCDVCKSDSKQRHKSYDKYKRNDAADSFYNSNQWKKVRGIRNSIDNGLCQPCLREGKIKTSDICHHIVELKDDWSRRFDIENLEMVCLSCHNKIHNQK